MKLTNKKITYCKKKNNPIAKMLKDPQFKQQKVAILGAEKAPAGTGTPMAYF